MHPTITRGVLVVNGGTYEHRRVEFEYLASGECEYCALVLICEYALALRAQNKHYQNRASTSIVKKLPEYDRKHAWPGAM